MQFSIEVEHYDNPQRNSGRSILEFQAPTLSKFSDINNAKFMLWFIVSGRRLGYYPECLKDIYIDIVGELEKIRENEDHDLTIAGYPIALVRISGEEILIKSTDDREIYGEISVDSLTEKLLNSANILASMLEIPAIA